MINSNRVYHFIKIIIIGANGHLPNLVSFIKAYFLTFLTLPMYLVTLSQIQRYDNIAGIELIDDIAANICYFHATISIFVYILWIFLKAIL